MKHAQEICMSSRILQELFYTFFSLAKKNGIDFFGIERKIGGVLSNYSILQIADSGLNQPFLDQSDDVKLMPI